MPFWLPFCTLLLDTLHLGVLPSKSCLPAQVAQFLVSSIPDTIYLDSPTWQSIPVWIVPFWLPFCTLLLDTLHLGVLLPNLACCASGTIYCVVDSRPFYLDSPTWQSIQFGECLLAPILQPFLLDTLHLSSASIQILPYLQVPQVQFGQCPFGSHSGCIHLYWTLPT